MRAALCLLLLLCVTAGAQAGIDVPLAFTHMCEIEEFLAAAFWNQTLAKAGIAPENVAEFHTLRTLMKAGRCVYTEVAQAIENGESAPRTCVNEHDKKTLQDGFREALSVNDDALTELKRFNAHLDALRLKKSDKEAERRRQGSIATLGHATANHDDAMREFQESQAALNTKLAGYTDRLARIAVGLPEFEPPSGEATAALTDWREKYELQSADNRERIAKARQQTEEALQRAEEGIQASDAAQRELDASRARLEAIAAAYVNERDRRKGRVTNSQ